MFYTTEYKSSITLPSIEQLIECYLKCLFINLSILNFNKQWYFQLKFLLVNKNANNTLNTLSEANPMIAFWKIQLTRVKDKTNLGEKRNIIT